MAQEKTIILSGTEEKVDISGQNCDIRNDGVDIVYASRNPLVVAGADGVLSVPAGGAAKLLDTGGMVYLLGTGSVQLCGNDYAELVFKSAATSSGGGGTVDDVARQAISTLSGTVDAHTGDDTIHLTAEKAIEAAATTISNPNLLDNPDFKINQRGQTEYSGAYTYTVDRWYKQARATAGAVYVTGDGVSLSTTSGSNNDIIQFRQYIEFPSRTAGKTVTFSFSAKCNGVFGNANISYYDEGGAFHTLATIPADSIAVSDEYNVYSISTVLPETLTDKMRLFVNFVASTDTATNPIYLKWVKLELGSVATPFTPPDPATELAKCQRYCKKLNGDLVVGSLYGTSAIWFFLPCQEMRINYPSIEVDNLGIKTTYGSDGTIDKSFTFSVDVAKPTGLVIRATKAEHGITSTMGATLHGGTGADFTVISAEL